MEEKILLEFTGEEMNRILEYQKKLEEIADDDFLTRFPNYKMDTVQKAIMNAIEAGLCDPGIII